MRASPNPYENNRAISATASAITIASACRSCVSVRMGIPPISPRGLGGHRPFAGSIVACITNLRSFFCAFHHKPDGAPASTGVNL